MTKYGTNKRFKIPPKKKHFQLGFSKNIYKNIGRYPNKSNLDLYD